MIYFSALVHAHFVQASPILHSGSAFACWSWLSCQIQWPVGDEKGALSWYLPNIHCIVLFIFWVLENPSASKNLNGSFHGLRNQGEVFGNMGKKKVHSNYKHVELSMLLMGSWLLNLDGTTEFSLGLDGPHGIGSAWSTGSQVTESSSRNPLNGARVAAEQMKGSRHSTKNAQTFNFDWYVKQTKRTTTEEMNSCTSDS